MVRAYVTVNSKLLKFLVISRKHFTCLLW